MANRSPPEITEDDFLGGTLKIRQPLKGYRAGVDAVLLAAVAPLAADAEVSVADLGAGVGTVGLCLAARCLGITVALVEREPALCKLARDNVRRNSFEDRMKVHELDITDPTARHPWMREHYDLALANPPFYAAGSVRPPTDELKAAAHVLRPGDLEAWARFMAHVLRPSGQIAIIATPDMLPELINGLARRFGDLRIVPVYARDDGGAAIRCIVIGRKGSQAPLRIDSGIILHSGSGNSFREEIRNILTAPQALDVATQDRHKSSA